MNILIQIQILFLLVGIGVLLKWYAKMIAWGVAEGWAKVKRKTDVNLNLGNITIHLKNK